MISHHEESAPGGINQRVDWFSKQQDDYIIPETCMIEDFHSIYGKCMNTRDCIRKRLVKNVADKAALEHKQSRTKGERPALIKFDKEHQIRELDLYAEHCRPQLELAMAVCFAVLPCGQYGLALVPCSLASGKHNLIR